MKNLIVLNVIVLFIVGCSSTKPHDKIDLPEWYLNPPKSKNMFYGVGDAERPQLNLSKKIATSRARDELARQISTQVRSMISDYQKASGIGMEAEALEFHEYTSGNVINMSLEYSMIEKTEVKGSRVFVLVSYDVKAAKKAAKDAMREAAKRQEAYRSELEARDAFSRLDAAIDKLEGTTGRAK